MADRYWVGGTDSWNGTAGTKRATTSGGAGGASVPTVSDNVFFDANSGAGTVTIASTTADCLDLDFTGFTGTLAGSTSIIIAGSLTLDAGMTFSYTGNMSFASGTGSHTITTAGFTTNNTISFNSSGSTWTIVGDWNNGTTKDMTLTSGHLILGANNIYCRNFTFSNSNVRTLDMTNATVHVANTFGATNINNLTLISTGSTIDIDGGILNGGNALSSLTYNNLITTNNTTISQGQGMTFTGNVTFNGIASVNQNLQLSVNINIQGNLTMNGNSLLNRLMVKSSGFGTARTITLTGTASGQYFDMADITGAGASSWDVSDVTGGSGDAGGNTNIIFTTAATQYWVGNGGSWTDGNKWASSSGGGAGSGRIPLPQDNTIVDDNGITSSGQTISLNKIRLGKDLNVTVTPANAPALNVNTSATIYGSLIAPNSTFPGIFQLRFEGEVGYIQDLNTGGNAMSNSVAVSPRGEVRLLSDLTVTGGTFSIFHSYGILNTNNFTVNNKYYYSLVGNRTLTLGSTVWNVTQTNGQGFYANNNMTVNAGTSTIKHIANTTNNLEWSFGDHTWNIIWNATQGANQLSYTNHGFTAATLKIDPTRVNKFLSGATFFVGDIDAIATVGNEITINSTVAASQHFFSKVGGGTVTVDYCIIQDSHCIQAGVFSAINSTDNGNNVNWFGGLSTFTSKIIIL